MYNQPSNKYKIIIIVGVVLVIGIFGKLTYSKVSFSLQTRRVANTQKARAIKLQELTTELAALKFDKYSDYQKLDQLVKQQTD